MADCQFCDQLAVGDQRHVPNGAHDLKDEGVADHVPSDWINKVFLNNRRQSLIKANHRRMKCNHLIWQAFLVGGWILIYDPRVMNVVCDQKHP